MAHSSSRLKVAAIVELPGVLDFMIETLRRLASTGRVEPMLLICRDDVPDPAGDIPWWRIPQRSERMPRAIYDWADILSYEQSFVGRDPHFFGRYLDAARSIGAETEQWYLQHPVDCALIWAGTRLGSRAAAAAARACGRATVTLETAFFSRLPESAADDRPLDLDRMRFHTLVWDAVQAPQCGPSQLTEAWRNYPIEPGLHDFLRSLQESKQSKYSRRDIASHLQAGDVSADEAAPDLTKPPGTRALLACGQLDWDSSVFFGELLVRTRQQLVEALASHLPPGWVLWFKAHPLDGPYVERREAIESDIHRRFPRCRCLPPDMNIHGAMQAADAVASITSTVGLEATTYGKPVLTLGEAFYSGKGFTYDVRRLEDLAPTISALPERMPQEREELRDRFLSYILYEYLLPVGRPERAVKRIEEAMERMGSTTPGWVNESAAERVARLEKQVQAYVDAAMRVETWFAREHELLTRERDVAARERDHLEQQAAQLEADLRKHICALEEMVKQHEAEMKRITSRRFYRWGAALALALRRLPGLRGPTA